MKSVYFLLISLFLTTSLSAQRIIYVNNAFPVIEGDGSSWSNPRTDLRLAIALANPGDQIWVAKGIYTPVLPSSTARISSKMLHLK